MCKGPVAYWAMAPQFACHHCRWQLSSNQHRAVLEGVAVGVAVELLLLLPLWWWAGSFNEALGVLLGMGAFVAYAAGWAVIWRRMVLMPRQPPVSSIP